ncbi:hypothetical protein [Thalassobacillus sp. C254]|uniref:hypothetical protein n=1 Tax=Thalassobacillus sp. C254 TaxID=1225341 RepID=UPI0006D1C2CC|nr:hypothetical protein [Thalassobacillus sp. C254]
MCGESDVIEIANQEDIKYIVDLRVEATKSIIQDPQVIWAHFPLEDGKENQVEMLKQAIDFVSHAYEQGKQVILH